MSKWNFVREERKRMEAGDYRLEIIAAEEKQSQAGNDMIVITVKPNQSEIKINHYFVKNQYFNRNMTDFFDSFNIEENNFNFLSWVGAVGAARLKEDEDGYLKIAWFINKEKAKSLPEWVGEMPERQQVSDGFVELKDDEELPF